MNAKQLYLALDRHLPGEQHCFYDPGRVQVPQEAPLTGHLPQASLTGSWPSKGNEMFPLSNTSQSKTIRKLSLSFFYLSLFFF